MKDAEKMDALREEYICIMADLAGLGMDRASQLPSDSDMVNHLGLQIHFRPVPPRNQMAIGFSRARSK